MAPWKVNSLTFPFVFCTWLFLLAARAMHGMPPTHLSEPTLPALFATDESLRFGHLAVYWLKGVGQVFLVARGSRGFSSLSGYG